LRCSARPARTPEARRRTPSALPVVVTTRCSAPLGVSTSPSCRALGRPAAARADAPVHKAGTTPRSQGNPPRLPSRRTFPTFCTPRGTATAHRRPARPPARRHRAVLLGHRPPHSGHCSAPTRATCSTSRRSFRSPRQREPVPARNAQRGGLPVAALWGLSRHVVPHGLARTDRDAPRRSSRH
jgi:hypothetical protein